MGELVNKVALITGGASGIGAACAETLAGEGAAVVISDLDAENGEALARKIELAGGRALYHQHDVSDETGWPGVMQAAEHAFGRMDILVANAGIGILEPVVSMTLSDWRRQIAVNLDGVFLSVKHAIPAMRRAGGGSIVIMSSVAGLRGTAGLAGYCATKGGTRLFAKAVAMECAAARDNIRVNTVHPERWIQRFGPRSPGTLQGGKRPSRLMRMPWLSIPCPCSARLRRKRLQTACFFLFRRLRPTSPAPSLSWTAE